MEGMNSSLKTENCEYSDCAFAMEIEIDNYDFSEGELKKL